LPSCPSSSSDRPACLNYAAVRLGRLIREVRRLANTGREELRDQLGPDFKDVDWKKLDARQYPRRIIRDALKGDDGDAPAALVTGGGLADVEFSRCLYLLRDCSLDSWPPSIPMRPEPFSR